MLKFKYYNFKDGVIRLGACVERVYEYYDLDLIVKDKTLKGLISNLKSNDKDYTILPYTDFINNKNYMINLEKLRGILVWSYVLSGHVGIFDSGFYLDAYNHFEYKDPEYVIILN